jgi:polar amino acid transport system substrate-binding protein
MAMRLIGWLCGAACVAMASSAVADDSAAKKELTPTGKLRAAIAWGPAPSGLYAIKDAASGKYRGVTIDLATELAKRLDVPLEFFAVLASGEIQNSAASNVWDVTFMPVDEDRKRFVDFGNAYVVTQSTYLVAPGSVIKAVADANNASVRVCGVKDTATIRAANRASAKATFVTLAGQQEAIDAMKAGKCDTIALGRESLAGLAAEIPGSRILDDAFLNLPTAVAVPKNRPAALAYATAFVEEAKAAGIVRRGLDAVGLTNATVAPAGMKP